MFRVVENVRKKHLDWVNFILSHRRWSARRLAVEAEIDPSTISRFLNDPTQSRMLNSYSIEKIEKASGVPAFETSADTLPRAAVGYADGDGKPYELGADAGLKEAISALKHGRNGVDPWVLQSRCLETAGYIPGDVLIVDLNAVPQNGDIVCAEIFDRNGQPETVFRIFEHPFLITATMDASRLTPTLIDKSVVVRGVVVSSLRERRAA